MKTSIVPIAVLLTCLLTGITLAQTAGAELTDDDWGSASPATIASLVFGHNDYTRRAYLDPCTNGYFYVRGEDLSAIGHLVTPTGVAKWDGRDWLPVAEEEHTWPSYPLPFTVGEDHYELVSAEDPGGYTYKLIQRGFPNTQIGGDFDQGIFSLIEYKGELYAGGAFISVGGTTVNHVARWDGTYWSPLGSGVDGQVNALAVRGENLYVGGFFQTAGGLSVNGLAKWDGNNWSPVGSVVSGPVRAMAVHGGDLFVAGYLETEGGQVVGVARWDGTNWSSLGSSPHGVDYMIVGADGNLYVAGYFYEAGGVSANCVARWDGVAWSTVGGSGLGISGPIYTMKAVGNHLYVGGDFPGADGTIANGLAKWDGVAWSVFGSGMLSGRGYSTKQPGTVADIAVSGSNVYVTGRFHAAGGVAAANIACWNGSSWAPLGTGLDSDGAHLAIVGSDLYVTGTFVRAGDVPAARFAKWDGTSWSSIDSPFQVGYATPLAVSGSTLYAGVIVSSNGLQHGVGQWDGADWTLIGPSDGAVSCMVTIESNLYVAGKFHSIGGVAATNVARWDGTSWAPLGPGIGDEIPAHQISAMARHGNDLYAAVQLWRGGTPFEDPPPSQLYRWDGISWTEVGSTTDRAIYALATLGDELYVGGVFSVAGGKASGNLARVFLNGASPLEKTGTQATSHFRGMPAGGYQVDRTTDFVTWENLATRYATETGGIDFTDDEAPQDKAFYRVMPLDP